MYFLASPDPRLYLVHELTVYFLLQLGIVVGLKPIIVPDVFILVDVHSGDYIQ